MVAMLTLIAVVVCVYFWRRDTKPQPEAPATGE